MGVFDKFRNWLLEPVLNKEQEAIVKSREYYQGKQKRPLKVKTYDDNLVVNFCGLIVDRSVSDMVGGGVAFTDLDEADAEYIQAVWDANKQEILLHRACLSASIGGTGYIKILPDGITDWSGNTLPRLVVVDPAWVTVETHPEDQELVVKYIIQYSFMEDGKEKTRREESTLQENGTWLVDSYLDQGSGKPVLKDSTPFPYPFAPIIHWQNLVSLGVYGDPDVTEDVIELQDKYNFVSANVGKIIRYHAHPKTVVIGASKSQTTNTAPDEAMFLPAGSDVKNLEMQSDLESSMNFLREMRQSMFDITRTVDIDSIQDKIGALTNFGLRVLYKDALAKIDSKRELFGDMLRELNRRLLILHGGNGENPGNVRFMDVLPANEVEEIASLKFDLETGIASKETAAETRGYDFEAEQEKIQNEQSQTSNIGALIMQNFNKGL